MTIINHNRVSILSLFVALLLLSSLGFSQVKVNLILSVDWEGISLDEHNLNSFRRFREEYPEIKIVHFLNAAYFLKPSWNLFKKFQNQKIAQKIQSVIRPGDELGVHIHAQETLLKEAGVEFRETETFWGHNHSVPIEGVRGHDVPLTLFTEAEIVKLLKTSVKILNENGFHGLKSFRAGGWAASPQVLSALAKEGFTIDSSAVAPEIVRSVAGEESPLFRNVINKLWKNVKSENDKPFLIETSHGPIVEIPNNFGLADYITGEEVFLKFQEMMSLWKSSGVESVNLHFGFHQETATLYLERVSTLIEKLRQYALAESSKVSLESKTFNDFKFYSQSIGHQSVCRSILVSRN